MSPSYLHHQWYKDTQSCLGRYNETSNCRIKDIRLIVVINSIYFISTFYLLYKFSIVNVTNLFRSKPILPFLIPSLHTCFPQVKLRGVNKKFKENFYSGYTVQWYVHDIIMITIIMIATKALTGLLRPE